jgi:hypothetical protein
LLSDAAYLSGVSEFSLPVSVTVDNPLPTTSILVPSKAATRSRLTYLDAAASNATSVEFLRFQAAMASRTGDPRRLGEDLKIKPRQSASGLLLPGQQSESRSPFVV